MKHDQEENPPIFKDRKNWDKISIDIYKEMYLEAKIKYDELLSQSESISKKSQSILLILGGIATWAASYLFVFKISCCIFFWIIFLFISNISILVYQFVPRKVPLRGTTPKVVLKDEVKLSGDEDGSKYNAEQKDKLFFYYQLCRYQDKCDRLKAINDKRAPRYKITLLLTFILFVLVVYTYFYYKPLTS